MPDLTQTIEQIKDRCNIVDVISPLVELKKAGATYKGCCPFHKEKTPSFVVSEEKGFYHCFGCGEHGDAFKFLQKYYNLSFPEAVERLATQYGIVIEQSTSAHSKQRDEYLEYNKMAAAYYHEKIRSSANKGYEYLSKRGMDAKTMTSFGVGWASEEWSDLTEYMLKNKVPKQALLDLGLSSEKNGKMYDKFRSRAIFPIINTKGKVIGFGGRIVGEGEPKYLNSPENIVFSKKNNLYGLNKSRSDIQTEGYAILVEGYMDCVSLYQYGIKNVVASLGTALTEEQARLLNRYTKKVILCYDADAAGIKAALRGIDVLRAANLEVRVLHVTDGKDPDEFVKKNGRDAFVKLIEEKSVADVDYKINLIRKKYKSNDTSDQIKFLKAVADVLRSLSPVESDMYIQKVALQYKVSEGALRREVNGKSITDTAPPDKSETKAVVNIDKSALNLEMLVIRLIMLHSNYYEKLCEYPEVFVSDQGRNLFEIFKKKYLSGVDFELNKLKDNLEEREYEYLKYILDTVAPGDDVAAVKDCLDKLERNRIQQRLIEISNILQMADSLPDSEVNQEQMRSLLKESQQLQTKLKGVK